MYWRQAFPCKESICSSLFTALHTGAQFHLPSQQTQNKLDCICGIYFLNTTTKWKFCGLQNKNSWWCKSQATVLVFNNTSLFNLVELLLKETVSYSTVTHFILFTAFKRQKILLLFIISFHISGIEFGASPRLKTKVQGRDVEFMAWSPPGKLFTYTWLCTVSIPRLAVQRPALLPRSPRQVIGTGR